MAKMEKRPIKMPSVLIQLGTVESIVCDNGTTYRWTIKSNCRLISPPDGKSLYCLISGVVKSDKKRFDQAVEGQTDKLALGMNLYERWNEFDPESASIIKPPRGFLFCVGRTSSITYRSDKWVSRMRRYIHTFKINPKVWVNRKKDPTLLVLTGGKIRTTKDGITG